MASMAELQRQVARASLIQSIQNQARYLGIGEKEMRRLLSRRYQTNALCFLPDEDIANFLDYLKEQEPGSPLGTETYLPGDGFEF